MVHVIRAKFVIERTTDIGNTWLVRHGLRGPVWGGDKSRARRFVTKSDAESMIQTLRLGVTDALFAVRLDELQKHEPLRS
jgi:hypothetical protein